MLPELLSQIPPDQKIASVTADGACDTRKCHDAIAERGPAPSFGRAGMRNPERPPPQAPSPQAPPPQAPPPSPATRPCARQNTAAARSGDDGAATTAKAASKFEPARNRSGDCFPGEWMHCVKRLGQRLKARDFDRQLAGFQMRVAVLNGVTALGTPVTEVAG